MFLRRVLAIAVMLIIAALTEAFHHQPASRYYKGVHWREKIFKLHEKMVKITNLENQQTVELPPGSYLSLAAARSGLRLSFQCKQGSCGSCETLLDGKRVRTCMTKVPDKAKCTIKKAPRQ